MGLPSQPPRPSLSEDKYIAFVSGLEVGNDAADPLRLSLVVDYLTGLLGSGEEQKLIAKVGAGESMFASSDTTGGFPVCMLAWHLAVTGLAR